MSVLIFLISIFIFSLVTSLREVLEAALIIGIILGYLTYINRRDLYKEVIVGIISSIVFSLILGILLLTVFESLIEYQELFEGVIMILAAIMLTYIII